MKLFERMECEKNYKATDAVIAIVVSLVIVFAKYFDGECDMIGIDAEVTENLINLIYVIGLVLAVVIAAIRNGFASIGINSKKIVISIVIGIVAGAAVTATHVHFYCIEGYEGKLFDVTYSLKKILEILLIAVTEEIVFRGFLSTRLVGLFKNRIVASAFAAILYVATMVMAKWPGISQGFIPPYIVGLILMAFLLHFATDITYKLTNNIAGAVVAHFIYLIVKSMYYTFF